MIEYDNLQIFIEGVYLTPVTPTFSTVQSCRDHAKEDNFTLINLIVLHFATYIYSINGIQHEISFFFFLHTFILLCQYIWDKVAVMGLHQSSYIYHELNTLWVTCNTHKNASHSLKHLRGVNYKSSQCVCLYTVCGAQRRPRGWVRR